MEDAMNKHKDADVLVNFASLRSAYESTIETMTYPQVNIFFMLIFEVKISDFVIVVRLVK